MHGFYAYEMETMNKTFDLGIIVTAALNAAKAS